MKNMSFKKFLTIYSIVLAALMVCFLIYVADSLVKYENNQLDNYMQNFIDDLKDAGEDFGDLNIKGDSLTFQQSKDSADVGSPVYEVMYGDNRLMKVTLAEKDKTTRLGLLSFNIWEVKAVKKYDHIADYEAAKSKIKNCPDVMEIARNWSLFLSNDLEGEKNGFGTMKEYLKEGTYLYQYAYNWATNIDITLISKHGFSDPMFSNEKVCNFEVYSDKEFSCDVYLQKNMLVHAQPLPDKMGERMHFVYCDSADAGNPAWKLLSMKAITVK